MLRDVFSAKSAGEAYARLARAHGYVDGFMRALVDVGFVTREELREIGAAEREFVSGPATRVVEGEAVSETAAAWSRPPSTRV